MRRTCFLSEAAVPSSSAELSRTAWGILAPSSLLALPSCNMAPPAPVRLPFRSSIAFKPFPWTQISSLLVLRKRVGLTLHLVIILIPPGNSYFVIVLYWRLILRVLFNITLSRIAQTMLWCLKKETLHLHCVILQKFIFHSHKIQWGWLRSLHHSKTQRSKFFPSWDVAISIPDPQRTHKGGRESTKVAV